MKKLNKQPRSPVVVSGIPRTIIGYGWPWTVRPDESLDFYGQHFCRWAVPG